ncbi:MAG: sulfur carrier protein ThiS adenylyltransferase ThiF [Proteobacteria bacterium]|nr:sulfur carrier protein ThiS adenylyltransferase ThiF [Pseudomonadota bacterium]MBU1686045.1 sulfur carrier protein ThiS adenylyltransferase ThiF [Pseudomonadota bacterium]
MVRVNEEPYDFRPGIKVKDLIAELKPDADVYIVNGFPTTIDTEIFDGDSCWLIRRGETPPAEEMERLLYARHTPGVHEKVRNSIVGIMGLGGLGSVVAIALARVGVGTLLLADYDVVEPSNLNRQQYFIDQIGMKKTEALRENLARVNPYLRIELIDVILTEQTIPHYFQEVDVLAECFDTAEMKAVGLRCALTALPGLAYVGASGVAGYEENNLIRTEMIRDRIYLVGDRETAAQPGQGLMAPRVGVAAHHQANQILRILLNQT